jgi:hypothetical protein
MGRVLLGRFEKSMFMVGLRGVGKTVLLNELEIRAQAMGYRTITMECCEGHTLPSLLAPGMRQVLLALDRAAVANDVVKRALRVAKSLFTGFKVSYGGVDIAVEGEAGVADSGDIETDLPAALSALAEAARVRSAGVALFVDEIQYLSKKEFSALIMTMQHLAKTRAPMILIGAGLPQTPALAGDSKSYAERLFNYPIVGPLGPADIASALREPVVAAGASITDEAIGEIANVTKGYPYFIQEWGYHSWNATQGQQIDREAVTLATPQVIHQLDEAFFRVRFDRLTPNEKNFLRAVAELGPGAHRTGAIADVFGVKVTSLGPVRAKLMKKGMIYSPAHGDMAFTVPLFDEFMIRTIPEFKPQG